MDAAPAGKRVVVAVTVPAVSVNGPTEPSTVVPSLASAVNDTSPVAPPLTFTVTLKLAPETGDVGFAPDRVVIVAVRPANVPHFVIKFATLTDPSPVARSYPVPATNAGLLLDTKIPNGTEDGSLQCRLPPTHATELFHCTPFTLAA